MTTPAALAPIHQCYFFGDDVVDPVKVFTQYLIRNPQYARQRDPACAVHLYVVDRPLADRLSCPAAYISKVTTTIGAIRTAAASITGEDFNRPPPTEAQVAARKAKKSAKKAKKAQVSAKDSPPSM
ncbi:MAG: hypothetical protein AAB263_18950 [Planctomycetota bacterium]